MTETVLLPLLGGALIGVAAGAFMILNGRIAGISGVLGGALTRRPEGWRLTFLLGLIAGGVLLSLVRPSAFPDVSSATTTTTQWALLGIAGLLVGFGTRLGGGCTSGHGVCGIGRFSLRSLVATATFIVTGVISVVFARALGVY